MSITPALFRPFTLISLIALSFAVSSCDPTPKMPLAAAAASGNEADVRTLLAAGAPPDDTDAFLTPLMSAARRGDLGIMRALIDAGADVNRHDARNHWTALLHALHKEQGGAAALLLERGADPNQAGGSGETPLMFAALDNDTATVSALLAHGARADARTLSGETALDIAVAGGAFADLTDRPLLGGCYPQTVKLLVAADRRVRVRQGFGPLSARWWAEMKGCTQTLALLR
jgi:ankyrin repeat protein